MTDDPLDHLRTHPVIRLAGWVAAYTGIDRNLVQLTELLSLIGGRIGCPLHLEVRSEHLAADLHLANRIFDLGGEAVARVDSLPQFRQLERRGLGRLHVIVVQARGGTLFREIIMRLARDAAVGAWPSVCRIDDRAGALPAPAALCLMSPEAERDFGGFAAAFATASPGAPEHEARRELVAFLGRLPPCPRFSCPFRDRYRGRLSPERALIVERVLQVFAASGAALSDDARAGSVSREDYNAARALLLNLPLTRAERTLPPAAVPAAEVLYNRSKGPEHQVSLPDRSNEGADWFTHNDAHQWTRLAYNTVKKYLQVLEEDGLVLSTVEKSNREHGRKIHFRFASGASPPFGLGNPFDALPELPGRLPSE